MFTVKAVSSITGISIRTLQYYDRIGLPPPTKYSDAGYRLYDEEALSRLQQILLYRELEFSLREIKDILNDPDYDREKAIEQQITLLTLKREHLDNLLVFACGLKKYGGNTMDFTAFDTQKMEAYAKEARDSWQHTDAYREYSEKSKNRSQKQEIGLAAGLMTIFEELGKHRTLSPASNEVQTLVSRLQAYISEHYYHCTTEILKSLGAMYAGGGGFTENIDKYGGEGTAKFAEAAIQVYCDKQFD